MRGPVACIACGVGLLKTSHAVDLERQPNDFGWIEKVHGGIMNFFRDHQEMPAMIDIHPLVLAMLKWEKGEHLHLDLKADGYSFEGIPLNITTKVLGWECVSEKEIRRRYESGKPVARVLP